MGLLDVYSQFDVVLESGEGCWVTDSKGEKYLDFYGGHGVISIGHCNELFVDRVSRQLACLPFYSNAFKSEIQFDLAQKLCEMSEYQGYDVFFVNSGTEAVENALKLASFETGSNRFIYFENSFHGRTNGALSVTDFEKLKQPGFESINLKCELNNKAEFLEIMSVEGVAGVIVEGVQGVGGLNEPSFEFWKLIREQCSEKNVLLIADEIQSGIGRSGKFFAHSYANIQADIVCVAKGLGNGVPIGGIMCSPELKVAKGMLGTTFGGNQLACVAAKAVLDEIEAKELMMNAKKCEEFFRVEMEGVEGVEVKGKGLMLGVKFPVPVAEMRVKLLKENKIITGNSSDPNLLRLLPPLMISEYEVKMVVESIKRLL